MYKKSPNFFVLMEVVFELIEKMTENVYLQRKFRKENHLFFKLAQVYRDLNY